MSSRTLIVAPLALLTLLVGPAAADRPLPGADPGNPITQVGPPSATPVVVDIRWPEGAQESVSMGEVQADASTQQLADLRGQAVAARAKAEGRSPITGALPAQSTRAFQGRGRRGDQVGYYACSVAEWAPWKWSSSLVATQAFVSCTNNVETVHGWIYLWRSRYFYLTGAAYYFGSWAGTVFFASGNCASSTWQYNASLNYTMDTPSGDFDFDDDWGPSWISC
jgi:hypothetical protein